VGQLLWREFFHFVGAFTENFDRIQGNPICRQIAWRTDREELFEAWRMATTGYPWIDAIMTQLRTEGWVREQNKTIGRTHFLSCTKRYIILLVIVLLVF
jgi:deoxyribodipyrimidine photolyase